MLIYNIYQTWSNVCRSIGNDSVENLLFGIMGSGALWLAVFLLQGVGLFVMAKKRNFKHCWLAFIPFVNLTYIGKLIGQCTVFGRKVKHLGVYAMIAEIFTALVCFLAIAAEYYLYVAVGEPILDATTKLPFWAGLTGVNRSIYRFYDLSVFIISILSLIYEILIFFLFTDLYKKYNPNNYFILSALVLFVPISRYIVVFVHRNKKAIDYEAYMREKREAFFRQQQQRYQNMQNGSQNGNTYTWGNPYAGPYTNPHSRPNEQKRDDEPFSEFSSDKKPNEQDFKNTTDDHDEFFN